LRGAEHRIPRDAFERELGHVRLAHDERAGRAQPRHGHLVLGGDVVAKDPAAPHALHALHEDVVLHDERHAVERTQGLARGEALGAALRGFFHAAMEGDDGIELRIERRDARLQQCELFLRRRLAAPVGVAQLGRAELPPSGHMCAGSHSTTCGA
jgi:hypothetical protein